MTYIFVPNEALSEELDCGVMPANVATLSSLVVGHKIVSACRVTDYNFRITLDSGRIVYVNSESDCCAYTELEDFFLNIENIEHIITNVTTSDGYHTWHVMADMGDVLTMTVGWSAGNPFYYAYGFSFHVEDEYNLELSDFDLAVSDMNAAPPGSTAIFVDDTSLWFNHLKVEKHRAGPTYDWNDERPEFWITKYGPPTVIVYPPEESVA